MTVKPRIAIVTNIAWNIYNFRRGLAQAIKDAGYEPVLMAYADKYAEMLVAEGWEFVPLLNMRRTGLNPAKDLKLYLELLHKYEELKITAALHFTAKPLVYGSLAATKMKLPYIANMTGLGGPFSGDRFFIGLVTRVLYKLSFRRSYKIVFQNEDDRGFCIEKKMMQFSKTVLIPGSGVNMEKFSADLYQPPSSDKLVFLMFARLSWAKGIGYYIEAAKAVKEKHPDVVFRLIGPFDSDNLAIKKEQINLWHKAGIIEYLGVSDFIQNEISQAHVIVYPSYYKEGIPKSLIEAAAMSKPIITTNNVGCKEVVYDGVNGLLVPVKDTAALIEACEKFIAMRDEIRNKMGEESRKIAVEKFDEKLVLKNYMDLISGMLK